jgi:hypothetical protein
MALRNFQVKKVDVPLNEEETMTVRGLTATDIGLILSRHQNSIKTLVSRAEGVTANGEIGNFDELVNTAITSFPDVVAEVICVAADEPDAFDQAMSLPAPVQLEAIYQIGNITFEADGGPKKTVETLTKVLKGLSGQMKDLRS